MTRRLQELRARQAQLIEEIEAEGGNCLKEAELMEISELVEVEKLWSRKDRTIPNDMLEICEVRLSFHLPCKDCKYTDRCEWKVTKNG